MGKKLSATLAGVAAAAVACTMAVAGPAAAAEGGQSSTADRPGYCDHVDRAVLKRQQVITRIEGDAGTRGSIAWLTEKATAATNKGNPDLATVFTDAAAVRSQVIEPLRTLTADLVAVQQAHCS